MPLFPVHQQRILEKQERAIAKGSAMASKRELIEPHRDYKRYTRREAKGEFSKEVDVGKSIVADRRTKAKTFAKSGQGDNGDRKPKR